MNVNSEGHHESTIIGEALLCLVLKTNITNDVEPMFSEKLLMQLFTMPTFWCHLLHENTN